MSITIIPANEPKITGRLSAIRRTITDGSATKLLWASSKSYDYYFYKDRNSSTSTLVREPRRKSKSLTARILFRTNLDINNHVMVVNKSHLYIATIAKGELKVSRIPLDKKECKINHVYTKPTSASYIITVLFSRSSIIFICKNNFGFSTISEHMDTKIGDREFATITNDHIIAYDHKGFYKICPVSFVYHSLPAPFIPEECRDMYDELYCKAMGRWYTLKLEFP